MLKVALLAALAVSQFDPTGGSGGFDPIESPIDGSGNLSTDLDFQGHNGLNYDDFYCEPPTTDTAARVSTFSTQGAYGGVNATNTAGGDLALLPSTGAVNFTDVTQAATTGDTIAFAYCLISTGACTTVTFTEGTDYDCDGAASDAECVCNLKTALDAHGTLGALTRTYATDATCSDERLAVLPDGDCATLVVTPSDGTNTVRTQGVNGTVRLADGTGTSPALQFAADADGSGTGIVRPAANTLGVSANGTVRLSVSPTAVTSTVPVVGPAGSVSAPAFATNAANTGMWADGTGIYLGFGGVQVVKVSSGGTLYLASVVANGTGQLSFSGRSVVTSPVDKYVHARGSGATDSGAWVVYPQTITCADSGDGNPSDCGGAQTIFSNVVVVNCADAHGCTLTLAETNYSATVAGNVVLHAGATQTGQLTLATSAAVVQLSADWTPAAKDTLCISYSPALYWAECGRSDNTP